MHPQNYSYFPIVLKNEEQLLKNTKALNDENIFPRDILSIFQIL